MLLVQALEYAVSIDATGPAAPKERENALYNFNNIANMNKPIALALLVGGIILIIFGVNESHSFGSDVNRFFTGNPTDKSMWLLTGGAVAAVIGLTMTLRNSKR